MSKRLPEFCGQGTGKLDLEVPGMRYVCVLGEGGGQWLVCRVGQNRYVRLSPHTDLPEALSKFCCFSLDSVLNTKVIGSFSSGAYSKNLEVQRTVSSSAVV